MNKKTANGANGAETVGKSGTVLPASEPDAGMMCGSSRTDIPKDLSIKLTAVSFFSACCIVLLHAFENSLKDSAPQATAWIMVLFSRVMTSFAVPLFFVISGYLFARKTDFSRAGWYPALLKKRAKTLLVPYVAWCTIYACTYIPFVVLGNHLAGRNLVFNTCLREPLLSPRNILCIYGLDFPVPPSAGALWYVRNLILLFLLAPLIVPVMKLVSGGATTGYYFFDLNDKFNFDLGIKD